jgi:DNA-directed RNA polymerase sigma subunit (sigma70/sigma32)
VRSPKENLDITMREDKKNKDWNMTQEEVAEAFGISRNYVQQIEKRALEKLRAEFKKRGVMKEDYLGED